MTGRARRRTKLALRDLGAASAFGSIAISGTVPLWALVAFGVGLVLALLDRRLFAGRAAWTAALLALSALALFGAVLGGGLDLVIAACSFASLVAVARMLAEPSPRTDLQVHLTGLLMISGGAALSGELLFALFLVGFALLATLSLGLSVVDEATPADEELPARPVLTRLAAGAVVAVLGAAAFFVVFPRVSWNLAARRASPGLGGATTGFSDRVRLNGAGTLKTNPRVVVRVALTLDPNVEQLQAYWIGRAFDSFNGREWVGTGAPRRPTSAVTLGPSSTRVTLQRIELLPAYDARTLVALDTPIMFAGALARREGGTTRTQLIEVEGEEVRFEGEAVAYEYQAYSRRADTGVASRFETPVDLARYRALPEGLDPRVAALARELLAGEQEPLRAAHQLASWLQQRYRYSLELPGELADPLTDFLFVRQEGHCEHFATALAILLRTQGFATRVAAGFFGGQRVRGHYVLRAGDAHAWTQVYVPGRGFVTVDATPEANRPALPSPALAFLTRAYETLESFWRSSVMDYSFHDQLSLARALVRPPKGTTGPRLRAPPLGAWLAAAFSSLVTYALWRLSRRERRRAESHPASDLLDRLERLFERHGLLEEGEQVEELARRLEEQGHPQRAAVARAVRRYLEARFGQRPLDRAEQRALLASLEAHLRGAPAPR